MLDKKNIKKIKRNMLSKKASLTREKLKEICLTKKLFNRFLIVFKITAF